MAAKQFPSRRDKIIVSAIDIIDELGIAGLSTKELAVRQEIAESALYRHFKSKDDILLEILKYFAKFDKLIHTSIRENQAGAKENILFFVKMYAEYYENYPAITAVNYYYTSFLSNPATAEVGQAIYNRRAACFVELIELAQARGEISDYFTSEELGEVLYGYFQASVVAWRMKRYSYSLKARVLTVLEKLLARC
ncbi:TetR/AcrR family transcriptional regulator [Propionispora vibrioides]|uniref:DNA-binding transcriptional regulator, AcrR family n=1 Tax=Propionispora vibrioides TaxID=112903 RepID=A0A1H8VD93_9FIRM|nr:TetR/AcrR family transcriptional regulator [Propionispora vibrioides]SEP13442.1 DNA-binding transcriptional regulator, AcrR family [Propionispora vibrioides]